MPNRRDSPFAARSPSTDPHWPPNVTGEEKAHGPTGTRTQDLSQTVRALWPLSYRATRSTCDNFPCLIRFVSESARNHAGTDETVPLLLAVQARTHTDHQMSQGRKKHMARPGLEPRTSRIPCEHSDHWATEPHGRSVTISPCLIRYSLALIRC